MGVYQTGKESLYVNFSLLRLTYKQDSDGRSQFEAASGAAMDAGNSHDARRGWMRGESCCRKCFMHSQRQLEVEHGFAKAICDTGEEKKPALQLCTMSE